MTNGTLEKAFTPLLFMVALLALGGAGFFLSSSVPGPAESAPKATDEFLVYRHQAEPTPPAPRESSLDEPHAKAIQPHNPELLAPADHQAPSDEKVLPKPSVDQSRAGQSAATNTRKGDSTLVVITNFTRATVTINDETYPTYSDDGQNRGLRLPSGQEHEVRVRFGDSEKLYRVRLNPGERRLLMVELTGMRPAGAAPQKPRPEPRRRTETAEEEPAGDGTGQITVYSRPRGTIIVGGRDSGEETPGSVDIEEGRHDVQVRYQDGQISETKVVRVREGSRIKLFFRQSD